MTSQTALWALTHTPPSGQSGPQVLIQALAAWEVGVEHLVAAVHFLWENSLPAWCIQLDKKLSTCGKLGSAWP